MSARVVRPGRERDSRRYDGTVVGTESIPSRLVELSRKSVRAVEGSGIRLGEHAGVLFSKGDGYAELS